MAGEDNDVMVKVFELAQRNFKEKKYQDCLTLLSRAIGYALSMDQRSIMKLRKSYGLTERPSYAGRTAKLYHPKLVAMLDSRAATYEKLKKLNDALKDGEQIVRVEPFNARGYIRSGKLLQALGHWQQASDVYDRGISMLLMGRDTFKLKLNEQMFKIMKEQRSIVRSKLKDIAKRKNGRLVPIPPLEEGKSKRVKTSSTKCLDPLNFLPVELMHRILSMLPLRLALRCRLISKRWDELIPALPLYNDIRLASLSSFKDVANCFKLVHRSKEHTMVKSVKRLVLPSVSIADESRIVSFILKQELEITGTLDMTLMDITMQQLVDMLRENDSAVKTLKRLKLTCIFVPKYEEQLPFLFPRLEYLSITPTPTRRVMALPKNYISPLASFPNLKALHIIGDLRKKYPSLPFECIFKQSNSQMFPNLQDLIIVGYDFSHVNSNNGTFNFLENFTKLRTLVLENNKTFTFRTLLKRHDFLQLPMLTKFVFREPETRQAEGLQLYVDDYLFNVFGRLQVLDLTGSSISYSGLIKLLRVCGQSLKHLYIGLCHNITFQKSRIVGTEYFNFEQVSALCPNLQSLYMNQSIGLSDSALDDFIKTIRINNSFPRLRLLDLSFNNELNGYKLLEFLKERKMPILVLHGIDLKPDTVRAMEKYYCQKVLSRMDRQYWREYGVNSYNPF